MLPSWQKRLPEHIAFHNLPVSEADDIGTCSTTFLICYKVVIAHFPAGTLPTHAFAGLPFTFTVQVPHSPFWQLYGTLTRAALQTTLSF